MSHELQRVAILQTFTLGLDGDFVVDQVLSGLLVHLEVVGNGICGTFNDLDDLEGASRTHLVYFDGFGT